MKQFMNQVFLGLPLVGVEDDLRSSVSGNVGSSEDAKFQMSLTANGLSQPAFDIVEQREGGAAEFDSTQRCGRRSANLR